MPTNLLLITADDLNYNGCGCYGCPVPGTTPHIDALAAQGMRFDRAHITIAVCQPSRGCMVTGRYPHRSGIEGFHRSAQLHQPDLFTLLHAAGYQLGCLGKVTHTLPKPDTRIDYSVDMPDLAQGRAPALYHQHSLAFIRQAQAAGQPFLLIANSHDPHRPFHDSDQLRRSFPEIANEPGVATPSRVYQPADVTIPACLPDLPEIRREMAEYYSSIRRFDDSVGAILRALDESGEAANTLVLLTTDHGMPLPFAKTNCYYNSTRTPLIARWPGHTAPNAHDRTHFIGGIDIMPTLLDAAGLPAPADIDGRSFTPVLRGQPQAGRERVYTQFHETAGRQRFPMRAVQDANYLYIFNPWSDGRRAFQNESQSGRTFPAMRTAAEHDPAIAARVDLFVHRELEELYHVATDPDCLHNLAASPSGDATAALVRLRAELRTWMIDTGDSALTAFDKRHDPAALAAYMADQTAHGLALRQAVGMPR